MKKVSVLIVVFSLLLITCIDFNFLNTGSNSGTGTGPNSSSRKFWAQNMVTEQFYQLDAKKLASNSRCEVWVEEGSGVTETTARNIADEYSRNIYVRMMNAFGNEIDDEDLGTVNIMEIAHYIVTGHTSDAKLTILLLDIKDGYRGTGAYVGGYFYAVNFFENRYSNEIDMIYLDTYPSVPCTTSFYETIAHEMQHLMNFVSSVVFRSVYDANGNLVDLSLTDTWIDEGLSAAAQWIYSGQDSEEHWKYYNNDHSGLIKKGNNFFIWNNHTSEHSLANLDDYATVYLFFQYLRLQSNYPDDIYFDIQTSDYSDYKAIINADSINSAHKDKWPLLLRDWHAANFTNAESGLYGYKNDPVLKDVKAPMFKGGTTVNLFPGEGVYSRTTTAESVPAASGYIRYSGLSSSGIAPNDMTGYADGARLTYNINTNLEGPAAPGSTTGLALSADILLSDENRSAQISGTEKLSGSYKVDAGYFMRKGSSGISDIEVKSILNGNSGRSVNNRNKIFKFDKSKIKRVFIDE